MEIGDWRLEIVVKEKQEQKTKDSFDDISNVLGD